MSDGSVGRRGEVGEEEAFSKVLFLFPQEACLRAPLFVFEDNYIWEPSLTVPPECSPTWWCLLFSNFGQKSNPPGGACRFFKHPMKEINWRTSFFFQTFHLKEASVCSGDGERREREREEDEADLCVPFFF